MYFCFSFCTVKGPFTHDNSFSRDVLDTRYEPPTLDICLSWCSYLCGGATLLCSGASLLYGGAPLLHGGAPLLYGGVPL